MKFITIAFFTILLTLLNMTSVYACTCIIQKHRKEFRHAKEAQEDLDGSVALYRTLLQRDKEHISWWSLSELRGRAPDLVWLIMKQSAREEFESGHYIAKLFADNPNLNTPANRAEILAIRESMHEQWKPQGGIEISLVDTMAISYFLMMF